MHYQLLLPYIGVFLIIYFISMIFCGIPVFLLEVSMGQYLGAGGMTTVSQFVPILKGTITNQLLISKLWNKTQYWIILKASE